MSEQSIDGQNKQKKDVSPKKIKKFSATRAPSREFSNPIYAGLEEDREMPHGLNHHNNWGPWALEKEANYAKASSRQNTRPIIELTTTNYRAFQQNPVMRISRPHAGFSFNTANTTDNKNQTNYKSKKADNPLPQIYQGGKTVVSFEPSNPPTLHDIRYRSQQTHHEIQKKSLSDKYILRNNFKIRMHPKREYFSQRNLQMKQGNNQKIGRFVYNWGYDQNVDDCLLNYYRKSHETLPSSLNPKLQKKNNPLTQENLLRKTLIKRISNKKVTFKNM